MRSIRRSALTVLLFATAVAACSSDTGVEPTVPRFDSGVVGPGNSPDDGSNTTATTASTDTTTAVPRSGVVGPGN